LYIRKSGLTFDSGICKNLLMEDETKRPGGARPGAGRKPGSGKGRKKTVLVAFEDPQIDWLKSQPQSPQDCIRGLVDDAMTRDNPQE